MRRLILTLLTIMPLLCGAQTSALLGIHVSKDQGIIDWPMVAAENHLSYIYINATEGATITDERFVTNIDQARKAGFAVGCIHRYDRHYSAQSQFDLFKQTVRGHGMSLRPIVYVVPEPGYDLNIKRLDMLLQLLEKEYGAKPILYMAQTAYLKYFNLERYASYHVLIASHELKFPSTRYTLWEYTDQEKIAGILSYVGGIKLHPTYTIKDLKIK